MGGELGGGSMSEERGRKGRYEACGGEEEGEEGGMLHHGCLR